LPASSAGSTDAREQRLGLKKPGGRGSLERGNFDETICWQLELRNERERTARSFFQVTDGNETEIIVDPQTGRSRGFAYVSVVDDVKAILDLDGQVVDGRRLHVEAAREWTKRPKGERRRAAV
jgi:RNA recognition motif-containing protein